MDDQRIVELYWQRDEQAIAETAAKYGALCLRISRAILASADDSEENVNDAYLHVWNAVPPERPRCLQAFLARITRNLAIGRYREKGAQKRGGGRFEQSLEELSELALPESEAENALAARELGGSISAFLRTQSAETRAMFVRRYFYCETVTELARRFGASESRVKMTLLRTRQKLKQHLEKEGYYEA